MNVFKFSNGSFGEFRQGWPVTCAGFLSMLFGSPTLASYSIGIFAPHLSEAFGWSYSFILGGLTILMFGLLPIAPLVGYLVDRHGARLVGAVSMALFGLSYMALSLTSGSKVLYIATWVAISIFGVGATPIVSTRAVNALFDRRRGLALGITLMGSGLFIVLVKLAGEGLIHAIGWRAAFVVVGALPIVIATPAIIAGFPRQVSDASRIEPAGQAPVSPDFGRLTGLFQVLKSWRFWVLVTSFLPVAFAGAAPIANIENILRSAFVPASQIPSITALVGIGLIVGRLCGGWVIDRVWAPLVTCVVVEGGAYGCYLLSHQSMSVHEAIAAVLLLGLTAGVELDLMSYLVVRYMGLKRYGVVYGLLYALFFLAAGSGPSFMARCFDKSGNYTVVAQLFCGLMIFAGIVILFLGRYPSLTSDANVLAQAGPRSRAAA